VVGERQAQVDGAVGPRVAHVAGRPPAPDQLELAERGLELGARGRGLDALERRQRALDARRLPARAEVRAHAGTQIARLADVERLSPAIAHDVDARPGRQAGCEVPPRPRASRCRHRQRHDVLGRLGAALLREPDQAEQHLSGCERVGQRAMARAHGHVEALGDAREIEARDAPGEQPPREADGVEHAHADARAVEAHQRAIEHADVERGVVGDEDAVAREREQLCDGRAQRPGVAQVAVADARDLGDARRHRDARVDEARHRRDLLDALDAHGADLDDAGTGADAGRLEVDDRPRRLRERRRRRRREADEADAPVPVPDEPGVVADDLLEHAAGELAGNAREREQRAGGALRSERLARLLDQCREPVSRPQLELELVRAGPAWRWRPACHANTCSQVRQTRTPPPAAC
jgi:hypothetical protein